MIPVFGGLIEDAEVCLLPFEVGAENGLAPSDLSALTKGQWNFCGRSDWQYFHHRGLDGQL